MLHSCIDITLNLTVLSTNSKVNLVPSTAPLSSTCPDTTRRDGTEITQDRTWGKYPLDPTFPTKITFFKDANVVTIILYFQERDIDGKLKGETTIIGRLISRLSDPIWRISVASLSGTTRQTSVYRIFGC